MSQNLTEPASDRRLQPPQGVTAEVPSGLGGPEVIPRPAAGAAWAVRDVLSVVSSVVLHLVVVGAIVGWNPQQTLESVTFAGQNKAVQIEASFVEPTPETPAQPVEISVQPPVEAAASASPSELAKRADRPSEPLPTDQEAEIKVQLTPAAAEMTRQRDASGDSPIVPRDQPDRRPTRRPPQVPMIAAVPTQPGTQAETPPDFSNNPPPRYPRLALDRGWHGTVMLRLHITAQGRVEQVTVVQGSGYSILDQAAIEAVRQWRGIAATRNGQPVASVEVLPIRFQPS